MTSSRHSLILLLLILTINYASAEHYHIVPTDYTILCQNYPAGVCFTLPEFASNSSYLDHENLKISFHPGEHILTRQLIMDRVSLQNIEMAGWNVSNSIPTIVCQGTNGFVVRDVEVLKISYLEFTGCESVSHGGAISVTLANTILIQNCRFFNNHVVGCSPAGGAVYANKVKTTTVIQHSVFANNSVINTCPDSRYNFSEGGGVRIIGYSLLFSTNNSYVNNSAENGGGLYVHSADTSCTSDYYVNNHADKTGGAVYYASSKISSVGNRYINNSANTGGAFFSLSGIIAITNDAYISNNASQGGAIYVNFPDAVSSTNNYFFRNYAVYGGAIYMQYTGSSCSSCNDTIISGDRYEGNVADEGAVMYKVSGTLEILESWITDNRATKGFLFINSLSLLILDDVYLNNNHGSLYVINTNVQFQGHVFFVNNFGISGGAISAIISQMSISKDSIVTISNNTAINGGGISSIQSHLHVYGNIIITENKANNLGGGIYGYQSDIDFKPEQKLSKISRNTASHGGGIYNSVSNIQISNTHLSITANRALVYGGGVYLEQNSKVYLRKTEPEILGVYDTLLTFANNQAKKGGAIYVADSTNVGVLCQGASTEIYQSECFLQTLGIHTYGVSSMNFINTFFINNTAHQSGNDIYGGLLDRCTVNPLAELKAESYKIRNGFEYIKATTKIEQIIDYSVLNIDFDYIVMYDLDQLDYMYDSDSYLFTKNISKSLVKGLITSDAVQIYFCLDNVIYPNYSPLNMSVQKGETIKVSLVAVDQVGNPLNATIISSVSSKSGQSQILHNQMLQQVTEQCTELEYNVFSVDESAELHIYAEGPCNDIGISSKHLDLTFIPCTCEIGYHSIPTENDCKCECDESVLAFCLSNIISPGYDHLNISTKKGEAFIVRLAVTHSESSEILQNATIISSYSSNSGEGHLNDNQVVQQVGSQCTDLEYNVFSVDDSAQVQLNWYVQTPCGAKVYTRILNITFQPCICSVGFQPAPSENDCICECDEKLQQHQITTCFANNKSILVEASTWIGLSNHSNRTGLVIHDCPFDYCVQAPFYVNLNNLNNLNQICAYNRTGFLCGKCEEGLSLAFYTSCCKECSNVYILLLIPFALAGVALVTFILLFNLTVAIGTIQGLIFYANILGATSLSATFATRNFLQVFISWLNLDLGIETCFYDGMDAYGKFLLQFAFPAYIFFLIVVIIVLCEVSEKFATLLSNRNPVTALCTLTLLSYSKLIRTIITALQFTYLVYPDGSSQTVWLYDANVPYFTASHIPRFIAAFIIIILGFIYTMLLLFGQWFPRCSKRKIMKWASNTKYTAFIDAYHAPFTPRHRYWIGLLLLALLVHNLVTATSTDDSAPILSTALIATGLVLLKLLNYRIYKNRLQDSLETLFLTNIIVLAVSTYNIGGTSNKQVIVAYISIAVTFILFLFILGYHFYNYILKDTKLWIKIQQQFHCQRSVNTRQTHESVDLNNMTSNVNREPIDEDSQLREPALDLLAPVYTSDYSSDHPTSHIVHKPPKITYTVIDGRPGHNRDGAPIPSGLSSQNGQEEA